jgi:MFS family permease
MRSLIGVIYALGGAAAGFGVGLGAALLFAKLTNVSGRDGAVGYLTIGVGLVGALVGLAAGMALYARSAPGGQGAAYGWSAILGVTTLVGVVVLGAWSWLYLMEKPLEYDGAMATLEMELRVDSANAPSDTTPQWLRVEVHTSKTRPEGTVRWAAMRTEGTHRIIPVMQNPLIRATGRIIVVQLPGRQTELFTPPMSRIPESRADWSAWLRPERVEPVAGGESSGSASSLVELRYRVRRYGE